MAPQNKIRLEAGGKNNVIHEDAGEELDETKLINGIRRLAQCDQNGQTNGAEGVENERPLRKQGGLQRATQNGAVKEAGSGGKGGEAGEAAVFKSANWLSDSELIFSLTNQVGGLVRALRVFQELDIGIKHVESRASRRRESEFEIFVDIDCSDKDKMRKLVHHLR